MSEFHFLRPLWLWALPVVLLLAWWRYRARQRGGVWQQVVDPALLPFLVTGAARQAAPVQAGLLALALVIAVLALAGPTWERLPVPVFRKASALVIALDLSASMNAADLPPSRLVQARFRLADLLALRREGQTGLVVFAAQSFVVTPLTDDTQTLLAQLRGLDTSIMPKQGSAPDTAVALAGALFAQAGITRGHVLLVTDGGDEAALARAATAARDAGVAVSVLGVGTAAGAPIPDSAGGFIKHRGEIVLSALDVDALRRFAAAHGGVYVDAEGGDQALRGFIDHLEGALTREAEREAELTANLWRERGPWLLLPLLPLVALGFRRGVLVALTLVCLPLVPRPAAADWWRTDDQAGARAFASEAYDEAATRFADPRWRGAARYRAGDYAGALADYAEDATPLGHYNRGNALARLGRYEEAIAAYERALEQEPTLADAQHNRDLLEELLREQQPPPQQQGQSENDEAGADDEAQDGAGQEQSQGGGSAGETDAAEQQAATGDAQGGEAGEDPNAAPEEASGGQADGRAAEQEPAAEEDAASAGEPGDEAGTATALSESEAEQAQATEQWLRQIPDDPAGLLRRKFEYQYKQRYGDAPARGERW